MKFELAIPASAADHALGTPQAQVTLVEYGDFECPHCKQAAPVVQMLLSRFTGRLRAVYRHFPLEGVHPHALQAALASEAAAEQGRFWPMHDALFAHQNHLKLPQLRAYADQLELDLERYDAEMAEERHLLRVREDMEGADDSGVRATPTFFINGALLDVSYGLQALVQGVEAALRN